MARLSLDPRAVAAFCRQHSIRRLSLFGSVLGSEFGPASDVDVLVEFEPGKEPGLLGLARMELDFSVLVGGRTVDMRTAEDLSRYFREEVMATAELQYAA